MAKLAKALEIIAAAVTVIAMILSIWQLHLAYYQMEYPQLNVTQHIDEEQGRLVIFIENTAKYKETGTINLFRQEISPYKPFMQLDSLEPGKNTTLNLSIDVHKIYLNISQHAAELGGTVFSLPGGKLYFATEKESISYKITCDNCYSQGVIKRIPDYRQLATVSFSVNQKNLTVTQPYITLYSWTTYSLADL